MRYFTKTLRWRKVLKALGYKKITNKEDRKFTIRYKGVNGFILYKWYNPSYLPTHLEINKKRIINQAKKNQFNSK